MRISQDWLNEYVETPPADELEHLLEMAGIGVEERDGGNFTLEVTSNRGDWLSAIGLAREISAMSAKRLRLPKMEAQATQESNNLKLHIGSKEDCARYHGTLLENITLKESPQWLQKRLIEGGMRPQNNVVDITNFVMLEYGQPLHAFDAEKLLVDERIAISVRRAHADEKLITLDGMEHELSPDVLCICNTAGPVALAGVMGGANSEVGEGTTKVLLEAAHFAPSRVRATCRALNAGTEASRRFERWVDVDSTARAAARATQLLCELADAQVVAVKETVALPFRPEQVTVRQKRANAMLGLQLSLDEIAAILERLQLPIVKREKNAGQITVETPSWRNDLSREIDLIEEVARLHGYDKIPETLPPGANAAAGRSLVQRLEQKAKEVLLRCGLQEVMTYSLENADKVTKSGLSQEQLLAPPALVLRNPLSEDYTQLRTSLLPSLLGVLQKNAGNDPKAKQVRVFEIGRVYLPKNGELPDERRRIGIALSASGAVTHWQGKPRETDFYTLKGLVQTLLKGMGVRKIEYHRAANAPFHPGRCASLSLDGEDVGVLGEINPAVQKAWGLPWRSYVALLDFEALVRHLTLLPQYQPIPKFPHVDRDLALLVSSNVAAAKINAIITKNAGSLLERVDVFDLYTGPPVPEGHKSMALSLRFRDALRTQNDAEVDQLVDKIVTALEQECGAKLRE